ncbi:MAG: DUF4347 domain-containing protein, partial [Bacteroidota bacterium]
MRKVYLLNFGFCLFILFIAYLLYPLSTSGKAIRKAEVSDLALENKASLDVPTTPQALYNDVEGNVYIDLAIQDIHIQKHEFDAEVFHLITHGKPGHLFIEGEWRDTEEIKKWFDQHNFLSNKKHLNIYGCEFAKGLGGKMALDYLAKELSVTIAASNDTTGIDGDWELEIGIPENLIQLPAYQSNLGGVVEAKGQSDYVYVDQAVKNLNIPSHKYEEGVFHLFSHGRPGHLYLEGSWRDIKQIKSWFEEKQLLINIKHLNIYGCEFAKGVGGKMELDFLAKELGITIAASDDTTGIDGDWELEVGIPRNLIQIPDYQDNLQNLTSTGNNTGINGYYIWTDFSYDGSSYEGFCTEFYDDVPQSGDVFSPSSTASHLSSSEEAQIAAALDAMDDESLGDKASRYTYIAYTIWHISDGLSPSSTAYETEINLILSRISDGTYSAPSNAYFGANQTSSSRQDMVFAPSTSEDASTGGSSVTNSSGQLHTGSFSNSLSFSSSIVPGGGTNTYSAVDGTGVDIQFSWDSDPPSLSAFHDNGSYSGLSSANFWSTSGMGNNTHTLNISFAGNDAITSLGFDMVHINESGGGGDKITITALTQSGASISPNFTQASNPDYTLTGNTADANNYTSANAYNLGVNLTSSAADPIASISIAWAECSSCSDGYHGVGMGDIHFNFEPGSNPGNNTNTTDTDGDGIVDVNDKDDDNDGILDEVESCGSVGGVSSQSITVELMLDRYPSETSWTLKDENGNTVLSGSNYTNSQRSTLVSESLNNAQGTYTFEITDQYSDGICCNYGTGYYEIKVDGSTVIGGSSSGNGAFGASASETVVAGASGGFACLSGDPSGDADNDGTPNYQDADFCSLNGNGVCSSLDTDGDGIIDQYDTDSDGDGCEDAIEGAASFSSSDINNDGSLKVSVDSDGIPGGNNQEIGTSQDAATQPANCCDLSDPNGDCDADGVLNGADCAPSDPNLGTDNDGDGVCDKMDLDDDNDGILDADEGVICAGNIDYEFYDLVPSGNTVENIPTSGALASELIGELDITNLQNTYTPGDGDQFSVRYTGNIFIATAASYTFYTSSDDGSALKIDGNEIVNNDGLHGATERSGSVALSKGFHSFELTFFENGGAASLSWSYSSPSISKQLVPMTILYPATCSGIDTDNDGTFDHLDTDADNDGCADAIEGGASFTTSDIEGNDRLMGAVDANGVPIMAGTSGQSLGGSRSASSIECIDTDNDGIFDDVDLDNDNDGIPDALEACAEVVNNGQESSSFPSGYWKILYYEGHDAIEGATFSPKTKIFHGTSYMGYGQDTVTYSSNGSAANNRWGNLETPTDPILPENYVGEPWSTSGNPFYEIVFRRKVAKEGSLSFGYGADDLLDDVLEVFVNGTREFGHWPSSGGNPPNARPGGGSGFTLAVSAGDEIEIRFINLGYIGGLSFTFITPEEDTSVLWDSDGDGIADCLDLDSDGDGCWDALEGSASYTQADINELGQLTVAVDTTGIPGGAPQQLGSSRDASTQADVCDICNSNNPLFTDNDNDGIGDFCDLDDDNDGITDTEEGCYGSGTQADPFTSLYMANTVSSSGRYYFDLGAGAFQADVDTSNGGGWVLILQYVHQGGTNPELNVIGNGADLPALSAAALGANESTSESWGHIGNAGFAALGAEELRWYGVSSGHDRIIHFSSTTGISYSESGAGSFSGINTTNTELAGHTANLPDAGPNLYADQGDLALTNFPYWKSGTYHWGIKGSGNRWEVDDYTGNGNNSTIHRVWARSSTVTDCSDTDNDGLADHLDLDADGDGCWDAFEGAGNYSYEDIDNAGQLTAEVDANGIPGGASQALGTTQDPNVQADECDACNSNSSLFADNDNDGVGDICDLDDDNDGILDDDECSDFDWAVFETPNGNTARGSIGSIGFTYTSSSTILTSGGIYSHGRFPAEYGVPNTTSIKNTTITENSISFDSPITNPTLVFASIGQPSVYVPIEFGQPIGSILYSQNIVVNGSNKITGNEGYVIMKFNGTYDSLTFKYTTAENYANFSFGAQNCQDTDNDGTPDYLDTDADGDGCADALEGEANFATTDLDDNDRLSGGVDENGIPSAAGAEGQAVGASQDSSSSSACVIEVVADAGDDLAICESESQSLSGAASGGDSTFSYSWSPTTGLSDANIANPTASPTTSTSYVLTVTDGVGTTDKDTVLVTVNNSPTLSLGDDVSISSGSSTQLSPVVGGGDGNYAYAWTPATDLSASNIANPTASPTSSITYTLTVTDGNGCSANDEITVAVISIPTSIAQPDTDQDEDGVEDRLDLDDDNDGILDTDEGAICTGYIAYEFYNAAPAGNTVYNVPDSNPDATGTTNEIKVVQITRFMCIGDVVYI